MDFESLCNLCGIYVGPRSGELRIIIHIFTFPPFFPYLINKFIKSIIQYPVIWVNRQKTKCITGWNNKFGYIPILKERASHLQGENLCMKACILQCIL